MSLRRAKEVSYISGSEAVEKHSLFARPEHSTQLADFIRKNGWKVTIDPNLINGEDNLLIEKNVGFQDLMKLVNEWKKQYSEASD